MQIYSSTNCKSGRCSEDFEKDHYLDKENQDGIGSPMKQDGDISLYENSSPMPVDCIGSPTHCTHLVRIRRPLQNFDANSRDSGYAASYSNEGSKFFSSRQSDLFGSPTFMEEDYLEICDLQNNDENVELPSEINRLIKNHRVTSPSPFNKQAFRRSVSMITTGSTPVSSRVRSCLFASKEEIEARSSKRSQPPTKYSPLHVKRQRLFQCENVDIAAINRPPLMRSISLTSATEDSIKSALQRSSTEPDLIGDFSKSFCLPLTTGRHQDLKSVTPTTLVNLMNGLYKDNIASYKVIDCRYPYEFNGGHIANAMNLYTKQQILEELLYARVKNTPLETDDSKRHVLVFHCEFSSERGPNL